MLSTYCTCPMLAESNVHWQILFITLINVERLFNGGRRRGFQVVSVNILRVHSVIGMYLMSTFGAPVQNVSGNII